jgi:hypothetical protein
MMEYLSFWFAKFLIDVFITFGFIAAFIVFYLLIEWKHGYKKNNK